MEQKRKWYVITLVNGQMFYSPSSGQLDDRYAGKDDREERDITLDQLCFLKRETDGSIVISRYQDDLCKPEGILKIQKIAVATLAKLQDSDFINKLEEATGNEKTTKATSSIIKPQFQPTIVPPK